MPDPVDWATARKVARIVARRDALADSYLGSSLDADFAVLTPHAEDLVAEFTGLRPPGRAHATVLDRRGWVDANVESMQHLLEPLMQRMAPRLARSPIAPVGRQIAGTEVGALVGYLAQRVLGQYDLLMPDDQTGDAVYYVGPNILALEKRFAFRPKDFRLWIAIHEVTHRAQFTGVAWLREYFFGLVQQAFEVVDPD
ncbi:MAG: zinc-dependent metalloprotease, partial [Acidimicrobiia bacterium]